TCAALFPCAPTRPLVCPIEVGRTRYSPRRVLVRRVLECSITQRAPPPPPPPRATPALANSAPAHCSGSSRAPYQPAGEPPRKSPHGRTHARGADNLDLNSV